MPGVRGLTLVVLTADAERFAAAVTLASANAALGGRTRVYCHDRAVTLLAERSELLGTASDLGVTLIACQSGLAAAALTLADLTPDVETGGLVSLVAELGVDRLVTI